MKRTYSALQALDLIFDPVEEERDEAEPAEEEEEEVSEGDEEEPPETKDIFQSKDGNIIWSSIPPSNRHCMLGAQWERRANKSWMKKEKKKMVQPL
ncbi:hypothetical protein KOW79_022385 [Hemibagrus wyckioides]|uniref:Uncharacterized protein n=1 Tax=Hemibagrus wyckioides TaxID=337641 RepID=A0A9D3N2Y9_9TELE|nr:hypothetical protein KOW79_022385 [Hemibagrus wyckioides]